MSAPLDLKLPYDPSHPTPQLLDLVASTIALPDTLPAPATYLVDDVCRAFYSPQSVSHGMSQGVYYDIPRDMDLEPLDNLNLIPQMKRFSYLRFTKLF